MSAQSVQSADPLLSVQGLHAHYGKSHILHGVDFHVGKAEVVSLLGRNGSGRSTTDRKSTRLNSSHIQKSRMPSSA